MKDKFNKEFERGYEEGFKVNQKENQKLKKKLEDYKEKFGNIWDKSSKSINKLLRNVNTKDFEEGLIKADTIYTKAFIKFNQKLKEQKNENN